QLFIKEEEAGAAFARLDDLDIADHIEASGPLTVTKTGELSLAVNRLRLVTKAARPLPDKWHGLADVELRYRRRYVDMVANPDVAVAFRARSIIIAALRSFLDGQSFVEVRSGPLTVTKTGELSLAVNRLRLVTKAARPLPDKWHGLADVELRYRRRYVDMVANPDVAVAFRARSIIIAALRSFLDGQSFVEVETPTLHSVVGGAAAHPFETHHNTLDMNLFLRIAPELYLKRLLVGGFERVYEIGRCYRNEGVSTRHNPEFTMLEFYQAYATYETLMPLVEGMFRYVDRVLGEKLTAFGAGDVYQGWVDARQFTLSQPFARVPIDRKSTRLNSSHVKISYAVFCLK